MFLKKSLWVICNFTKLKSSVSKTHFLHRTYGSSGTDININNISVTKYIYKLEQEYRQLCFLENINPEQHRRLSQLQPIVKILEDRNALIENVNSLEDLLNDNDTEIQKMAEEEKQQFKIKLCSIDGQLSEALLPVDDDDYRDAIVLEVNTGIGGQEAMLFAKELFDMYCNFAEYKSWNFDIAAYLTTDLGGIRHASALIKGDEVFRYFKYEAGVHRVQRIPTTEKSGRIHTSTVSVLALPQPTEIEIKLENKDLKIETKRASGAGGQHVNTTDSAVRITHLPTGLSVDCQVDRSQIKNKSLAMQRLRALLYQQQLNTQKTVIEDTKKSQVRSNYRNEKIRTYNFCQDRITDHRLQSSNVHNLKVFLSGGEQLEDLINKLNKQYRFKRLLDIMNLNK